MRVALVLPPLCQLNTPYPGTAYLARFLRDQGHTVTQRDLGLELMLRVLSPDGLTAIFEAVAALAEDEVDLPEPAWRALALRERHIAAVGPVVRFLQGRDRTLASRVLDTPFLPLGPRLESADLSDFGELSTEDAARHLATLYVEDLCDLVTSCVDPGFALSRYQHQLAQGPVSFDPIAARLAETTLLDGWLDALADEVAAGQPELVGISVPFPGTLYGALRIGQRLRQRGLTVVMGGGYVNTELREVSEPRLWDCVDALTYDDGEGPLLALIEHLSGGPDRRHRTRDATGLHSNPAPTPAFTPAAWYGDLRLDRYLQLVDAQNPAHRLWGDGRWNKITVAHGCYWKKCAFCDVSLDYISRYEPARVSTLVDHMQSLLDETGVSGFHLVDEAAPPKLLRDLALELLRRNMVATWWGNIRFERAFTPDLCRLLAASGCVMVTGGLEVAGDRLLKLMDKGITVEQAARAAVAFRKAGVLVHAYLMYGFPTESVQESMDAMEIVRQLFAEDALSSAFWHRFVLTRHSGVFAAPDRYKVRFQVPEGVFAANDIPHEDPTGGDHDRFDEPLVSSLSAWMHGRELDRPLEAWFPVRVPKSREPRDRVKRALGTTPPPPANEDRLIWLGGEPLAGEEGLVLHGTDGAVEITANPAELDWIVNVLEAAHPGGDPLPYGVAVASFPGEWRRFERTFAKVREAGLVIV